MYLQLVLKPAPSWERAVTPARWHAAALMWSQSQPLGLGKPMIGCDTVPWALLYWPQHCIWGAPKQKRGALSPGLSEPQRWDGDPRLQAGPQGGAGVPLELCVGDSACSSAPPGAPKWCVLPFQFQWLAFPQKMSSLYGSRLAHGVHGHRRVSLGVIDPCAERHLIFQCAGSSCMPGTTCYFRAGNVIV